MRKNTGVFLLLLALLALTLAACEADYAQQGSRSTSRQGLDGGEVHTQINKANGSTLEEIEVDGSPGFALETDVTLTVAKGMFRIELIGRNEQVTLSLEAQDGQTVSGHGWMAVDSFGDVAYRVTAVDAENVEYTIEYVFY